VGLAQIAWPASHLPPGVGGFEHAAAITATATYDTLDRTEATRRLVMVSAP
jgi:hypothetical protein